MKHIKVLTISFVIAFSSISKADWLSNVIDYGLPCLVSFGLGQALGDGNKNKTAIGAVGCGTVTTATFLNKRREKVDIIDEDFKKFVKLMNEKMDEKTIQLEKQQAEDLASLKSLMKDVMAERLIQVESEMKVNVEKYLTNADFMQSVEKKLMKEVKDSVAMESKANQKEIVNKCIDEALNQIVKKKYGTTKDEIIEDK